MDIFDRLGNLIRTILDDEPISSTQYRRSGSGADPDFREAWEELEDYMNEDNPTSAGSRTQTAPGASSGVPDGLRKDFRNLEVPFGAPFTDVRRSYKRLMTAFHPDRHSADPEKFRTATEVSKKLNQSFERIETYYEAT